MLLGSLRVSDVCARPRTQLRGLAGRPGPVRCSAHPSVNGPAPNALEQARNLVAGRRALEWSPDRSTIAGVTFEGRQELIKALVPGDKLLLEREPWNAYDSAAVTVTHVRTGALLGYVPRGSNNRMKHEALFGTAVSCGPELKGGNWGATFEWRPILADLVLDLIPLSAVQSAAESAAAGEAAARTARVAVHGSAAIGSTAWGAAARAAGQVDLAAATSTDVARWLAEGWWEWLSRVSLREANDRCEVTGLRSTETPLTQVPVFRHNTADRAVTLLRLMTVSTPLAEYKTQLEAEVRAAVQANKHDSQRLGRAEFWLRLARSHAGQQFSLINNMGEEEMGRYLAMVAQRLARAEEQGGWRAKVQPSVQ